MDKRLETEMIEFLYNAFEQARDRRAARALPRRESRWTWAGLARGIRALFNSILPSQRHGQDRC